VTDLTLPGNLEAESALLGRLLLEPRQIILVAPKLQAADFLDEGNRQVYQAMMDLAQDSRVIDVTTLTAELQDGRLDENLAGEATSRSTGIHHGIKPLTS
jgi:replicative DNA helicase